MKYKRKFIDDICRWVAENGLMDYGGATLAELCGAFRIDTQTYYRWLEKADFAAAIEKAKEAYLGSLERRIVNSLGRAAMGGEWEEVKQEFREGKDGKPHPVRMTKTTKRVEPSVGAAVFLLTNRFPERWQNKQVADVSVRQDDSSVTREEILREIEANRKIYEGELGREGGEQEPREDDA